MAPLHVRANPSRCGPNQWGPDLKRAARSIAPTYWSNSSLLVELCAVECSFSFIINSIIFNLSKFPLLYNFLLNLNRFCGNFITKKLKTNTNFIIFLKNVPLKLRTDIYYYYQELRLLPYYSSSSFVAFPQQHVAH